MWGASSQIKVLARDLQCCLRVFLSLAQQSFWSNADAFAVHSRTDRSSYARH
eukprot:m.434958 g.434958  ORF g.434958 m.434958 type:complete len:52 (-) comp21419_c0_seq73:113-268(-)